MKKLLMLSLIVMGLGAAYVAVTLHDVLPKLREATSLKPGSEGYEINAGCMGYYQLAERWPRDERELRSGLAHLKIKPEKIGTLKSLRFSNEKGAVLIQFTTAQGFAGVLEISSPQLEASNQSPATFGLRPAATHL